VQVMIQGREYSLILGSDVDRDGMYLELYAGSNANGSPLADYFYSDQDGSFSLTVYAPSVPADALAWLRSEGDRRLPPGHRTA
jgi:hypothetical protein